MMTREEFHAKQREAVIAFERQSAIAESFAAAGLPIPEYIADGNTHGAVHVAYRNDIHKPRGLEWAIDLFARFPRIIPAQVLKSSSTTIHPEVHMTERMKQQGYKRDALRRSGDYACWLSIDYAHERHSVNAKMEFFVQLENRLLKVSIDFGNGYIGACQQLRPDVREVRGANNGNRVIERVFNPKAELTAVADCWFAWGVYEHGPIKNNFDAEFLFVAENYSDPIPGGECVHALEMLRTLAATTGA